MKQIFIADGFPLFSLGIQALFNADAEFRVNEYANSFNEACNKIKECQPDILLIDFETLTDFSVEEFTFFKRQNSKIQICVISNSKNKELILKILKTGITTFISKNCDLDELKAALSSTIIKEKFFSDFVMDILLDSKTSNEEEPKASMLTNKEIEIVRLLSQGLTTKDIAAKLFISHHTVNTHRKNILAKLQIKNTSELVTYAMRNGWIDVIEYYI